LKEVLPPPMRHAHRTESQALEHGGMASPSVQVPTAMCLAIVIGVALMPEPRSVHLMLLIVPMSLLGAIEVDTLKRGLSGALDWFGILTFGLLGAVAWPSEISIMTATSISW